MDLFGSTSGSKLNHDNCWGIWLGALKTRNDKPFGINWTNDVHKLCGIKFGKQTGINCTKNLKNLQIYSY
jgi:hypothetical protein